MSEFGRLDAIEERLSRLEQALERAREQRIEDRLDRLSLEVGLVLQTLNQHTRMLLEIQTTLRERGSNGSDR
jgi:hypothetical protein